MERITDNQEKMMAQITNMRQRMKAMDHQNQRVESMLLQIMKAQNIEYIEEDEQEEELHLVNIS